VNSKQIRFHRKKCIEAEERPLSQCASLYARRGTLRVGVLFGVGLTHASDFGIRAMVTLLTVTF